MPVAAAALRRRLTIGLIVTALVAYEAYALLVKRSGEAAFLPPAADLSLSPEIAGEIDLQQTFVMYADGLEAIRVFPRRSTGEPQGPVAVTLIVEGYEQPLSFSVPASEVAAGRSYAFRVPRVDASSGRLFTFRMSLPQAAPGQGLRFEIGGPGYGLGELWFGGRSYWGDLKFTTRATRVRLIDSLADLRRQAPPLLRSDVVLVAALVLFNWALVTLVVRLMAPPPSTAPAVDQPMRS